MNLVGIIPDDMTRAWPACAPHLKPALERTNGLMTPESIVAACKNRDCQLWAMVDGMDVTGAAVTEVRNLSSGIRTVHILAMGAKDMTAPLDCADALKEWAKSLGAVKLTADCRPGMPRKLKDWRLLSVLMEKDIV